MKEVEPSLDIWRSALSGLPEDLGKWLDEQILQDDLKTIYRLFMMIVPDFDVKHEWSIEKIVKEYESVTGGSGGVELRRLANDLVENLFENDLVEAEKTSSYTGDFARFSFKRDLVSLANTYDHLSMVGSMAGAGQGEIDAALFIAWRFGRRITF